MFAKFLMFFSLLTFISCSTRLSSAQETRPSEAKPTAAAAPDDVQERQLDVSYEARDVERILLKLKRASELSKKLISEGAQATESVSAALTRNDVQLAQDDARQAAETFGEIAKLLEALLAEETPPRIAAARDLANQLAKLERQLAEELKREMNTVLNPGRGAGRSEQPQGSATGGSPAKNESAKKSPPKPPTSSQGKDRSASDENLANKAKEQLSGGDRAETPAGTEGSGRDDKDGSSKDGAGGRDSQDAVKSEDGGSSVASDAPKTPTADQTVPKGGGGDADDNQRTQSGDGGSNTKNLLMNQAGVGGKDEPLAPEERRDAMVRQAGKLARNGLILEDILKTLAESNSPGDQEQAEKVAAAINETNLLTSIAAMQDAAGSIRDGQMEAARMSALDAAERLEITAQRLEAAYRSVVAPQAEELRQLEQALSELREKLDNLESQAQIAAWHREANELLEQAMSLGIPESLTEEWMAHISAAMSGAAKNRRVFNWQIADDRYVPPADYEDPLIRLQEEVQDKIRALLINDLTSAADENTPPAYRDLVERYYEVLATGGTRAKSPGKPAAKPAETRKASSKPSEKP